MVAMSASYKAVFSSPAFFFPGIHLFLSFFFRFQARALKNAPQRAFASCAALLGGDVAVAVDDHVNRIALRVVHRSKIGVFGKDDRDATWVCGEILFDLGVGFEDVDREDDQSLAGKFLGDAVDQVG